MKIGILTFHRAINYGAVLQCYALKTALSQLGHEVKIIDYRPPYIEKYREIFSVYEFCRRDGFVAKAKYLISCIIQSRSKYKARKVFDLFLSNNFDFTSIVKREDDIPQNLDCIIFGSDQIWSPSICDGFDKIFWGQFKHQKQTKFISYAASKGGHNILDASQKEKVKNYLRVYDAISVREGQLKQEFEDLGYHPKLVVDPTLLLQAQIYERMAVKPKKDNYTLLFTLDKNKYSHRFAMDIANQLNNDLIIVSATMPIRRMPNCIYGVSPEEFLGYIKYARCIVCMSFHATAFSIIFRKDFYCLKYAKMDRAMNLLQLYGIENRMVDASQKMMFSPVSYNRKNDNNTLLKDSIDYLKNI